MSNIPSEGRQVMPPPDSIVPDAVFKVPTRVAAVDPKSGLPKRGRGRPPGSPNKPKVDPGLEHSPPMRLGPGPSSQRNPPRTPSDKEPVDVDKNRKAEKAGRAAEYAVWINEELNDKLFMFFLGATGLPAEAIYTAGSIPLKAKTNPNLTELGNRIAIPVDLSDSLGKILAELSYTKAGTSATKVSDNTLLAISGSAIVAVFSGYRYFKGLQPIIQQLQDAQAQRQANESNERNDGTNTET